MLMSTQFVTTNEMETLPQRAAGESPAASHAYQRLSDFHLTTKEQITKLFFT